MKSVVIQLYKLCDEAPVPAYGTTMSACFDLTFQPCEKYSVQGYDNLNHPVDRKIQEHQGLVNIQPGDRLLIPTGLIMKIRGEGSFAFAEELLSSYSIRLHARSGIALKKGLVLANAEGIIDVDYQKEIFVMLTNISQCSTWIEKGERIAQAEVVRQCPAYFELVNTQPKGYSERNGGFGSTGHN